MNRVTIDLTNHLQYSIHRYLELVHAPDMITAEQMAEYLELQEWLGTEILRAVSAAVRYPPNWPGKTEVVHDLNTTLAQQSRPHNPSTNQGTNPCE